MERIGDPIDFRLLDEWQREFPLVERPFAEIGLRIGCAEVDVVSRLAALRASGRISRVGATCAPNTVSASTLAALSASTENLETVAEIVGRQPGVNHSYLRENHWNLWFVTTGPDRAHVDRTLDTIRAETGLQVLDLPLVRPFNVDLGFKLTDDTTKAPVPRPIRLDLLRDGDRAILQSLTTGMPLCARPFALIAKELDRTEEEVLARIDVLQQAGIISRLGVIVRHRALGWSSNAMVVWDVAAENVTAAGTSLAAHPGVTLCYERRPVEGVWPFRLYCMIHAKSRGQALDTLTGASMLPELADVPYRVLFSSRCFKQTGALIAEKIAEKGEAA
ncbi:MAG: Lrp/AsnC family transcriptional regulator [Roseibium sp.]|uniref:siroheme decarboxylase subunit beta n=1 Tax=Roseibium sp. TaxID=1936156 RepID=UPI00260881FB|nr:Lrp/AsnC family transcriptional regulator [Roseibium sp.]MCV0426256.1 Lrp/AsnC family transcriptional regulator [Roseibium sp.]